MNVYLAAQFPRLSELNRYRDELAQFGIGCTSRWLLGGHEWVGTSDDDIPVDRLAQFADEDIEDLLEADVLVCFTEAPRSGPARGGRHVEMGFALAAKKPIICVGHRENVFYCLGSVIYCPDWDTARANLVEAARTSPLWPVFDANEEHNRVWIRLPWRADQVTP